MGPRTEAKKSPRLLLPLLRPLLLLLLLPPLGLAFYTFLLLPLPLWVLAPASLTLYTHRLSFLLLLLLLVLLRTVQFLLTSATTQLVLLFVPRTPLPPPLLATPRPSSVSQLLFILLQ